MKIKLSILALALCVGVGVWYYQSGNSNSVQSASVAPVATDILKTVENARPTPPPIQHDNRDLLQEKANQKTVQPTEVTDEQKQRAAREEAELLSMAAQYDEVRSDPELREQHRTMMKDKLAQYSQNAAPVILEQIQKQQSVE